jgi:hypothetical protein
MKIQTLFCNIGGGGEVFGAPQSKGFCLEMKKIILLALSTLSLTEPNKFLYLTIAYHPSTLVAVRRAINFFMF